jgi:hypothetical protein
MRPSLLSKLRKLEGFQLHFNVDVRREQADFDTRHERKVGASSSGLSAGSGSTCRTQFIQELTPARPQRKFLHLVIILSKLLIVVSLTGLLRCSGTFRNASREFDEKALAALKQAMSTTESMGYPSQLVPMLILLGALFFMLAGTY